MDAKRTGIFYICTTLESEDVYEVKTIITELSTL